MKKSEIRSMIKEELQMINEGNKGKKNVGGLITFYPSDFKNKSFFDDLLSQFDILSGEGNDWKGDPKLLTIYVKKVE